MSTDATNQIMFGGITCGSGSLSGSANTGNHYQPNLPSHTGELNFAPDWQSTRGTSNFDDCGDMAALGVQRGFRAVLQSATSNRNAVGALLTSVDMIALERMAIDPTTPPVLLEQLSQHPSADLRAMLAENTNTPEETMWKLVYDSDPDVRYQLAENPHIASDLLKSLTDDDNPYVACRAQQTLSRLQAI